MSNKPVLVVGTTSDYIDLLRQRFPGRSVFLTDVFERSGAAEPAPPAEEELLCDLACSDGTLARLREHVARQGTVLGGIACFDCESMLLAAKIARSFSLPYVTEETVLACRSKHLCKNKWREAGLPCPEAQRVENAAEAETFLRQLGRAAVIKPVAGSGSEYVFRCSDAGECRAAFAVIEGKLSELRRDPGKPLYSRESSGAAGRPACVMEELVTGVEYSCDFAVDGGRLEVLRTARKIPAHGMPFGTTLAYLVPAGLPPELDPERFRRQLRNAARALGIERAVCMLDFIASNGQAVMLEMTPRPGGDCLPPLLMESAGLDMLGVAIDFAAGHFPTAPPPSRWRPLVGLRLIAPAAGTIAHLGVGALKADGRVVQCLLKHGSGHRVLLPPEDYDSRLLGHVIFAPSTPDSTEAESVELAALLEVEMAETA